MYLSLMTVCLHFSIEFLAWISYTFTLDNESALAVYYIVMGVLCMIVTVIEVNILYPYLLTPRYSSFIQLFGIFAVFLVKFIPIIFTSNYFIDDKKNLQRRVNLVRIFAILSAIVVALVLATYIIQAAVHAHFKVCNLNIPI